MIRWLSIFNRKSSDLMMFIAGIALAGTVMINAVEIFRRYCFGLSFYWIQDITLLGMMWFIFPGIVKISYNGSDIAVDFFVEKLPEKAQRVLAVLGDLCVTLFSFAMCYYSIRLTMIRMGKAMNTSEIPLFWYTLAMDICLLLLGLIYFEKMMKKVRPSEGKPMELEILEEELEWEEEKRNLSAKASSVTGVLPGKEDEAR